MKQTKVILNAIGMVFTIVTSAACGGGAGNSPVNAPAQNQKPVTKPIKTDATKDEGAKVDPVKTDDAAQKTDDAENTAEAKARADADAKAAEAKAQADADAHAAAEAQKKADADAKALADAKAQAEAAAHAKTIADAQAKAEADAKAAAAGAYSQGETIADAQAKAEANARAEADAQAEANAKAEAEANAKLEADAKAEADSQAARDAEAKAFRLPAGKKFVEVRAKSGMPLDPTSYVLGQGQVYIHFASRDLGAESDKHVLMTEDYLAKLQDKNHLVLEGGTLIHRRTSRDGKNLQEFDCVVYRK